MEFKKLSLRLQIFIAVCILSGASLVTALMCCSDFRELSDRLSSSWEIFIQAMLLTVLFYLMKGFTLPWSERVTLNCASVVISSAFFICGPLMLVPLIAAGVIHGAAKRERLWSMTLNAAVDMIRIVPVALLYRAAGVSLPFNALTASTGVNAAAFILWFIASDMLILQLFTVFAAEKPGASAKPDLIPALLDLLFFPISMVTSLIYSTAGLPGVLLIAGPAAGALYVYRYGVGKKTENEELKRLNRDLQALGEEKTALLEKMEQSSGELKQAHRYLLHSEKLASLGKLAAGVAHELNTPLGAILTNAEFALSFADDDDMQESLELIKKAALRCRTITQRLLSYSRKDELRITSFPLARAVKTAAKELMPLMEEHHITLEDRSEPDLPVEGVFDDLVQILSNLMKNGIDAIADRKPEKGVITVSHERAASYLRILVKDNGTGIGKDLMERIFDPFFTTKDVGKGTGLGLWMSKTLIQRMKGRIHFRSLIGEGSEFIVEIPQLSAAEARKEDSDEANTGN